MQPYLFLDAGGTILFPNFQLLRQLILEQGTDVGAEHLKRIATEYIKRYDEALRDQRNVPDFSDFLQYIFERAGMESARIPPLLKKVQRIDKEKSLWASTFPWVRETLARLSGQGYHMSIISNADGRVQQELEQLSLVDYFDDVFDSHLVGYAKPDVRLFQHALATLGLRPEQCLFVGDVYYIDVLGANRAGIAAVHLDPYNLYTNWKGCHIPSIAQLPDLLNSGNLDLMSEVFFPLRQ